VNHGVASDVYPLVLIPLKYQPSSFVSRYVPTFETLGVFLQHHDSLKELAHPGMGKDPDLLQGGPEYFRTERGKGILKSPPSRNA
jgi:hypothetical protein